METLGVIGLVSAIVCALNLTLIAALPTVLFKPGVKRLAWWLTAAPLMLAGGGVLFGFVGTGGWSLPAPLQRAGAVLALAFAVGSISLIRWAGRSHRKRLALWHQEDDRPEELVTWGPYRHVRHPLYAAFLLTLVACLFLVPGWTTGLALVAGVIQLNRTAAREERRIARSPFGADYTAYSAQTGRFVPQLRTGI